ncbi:16S rRNA (cytidine(1402)-2'-O)-methyltransferase [Candidatus Peregrinibacteria bacterium]|jgi:16S rRNA (cytidine1402-2'-O)-methyltransferase|nr:16S rRNA (cytidine(1402)-2'-O)-methyltransferase [Candidatus Peregrinibacteria bacterium]MBT4148724.1 16S rRNA (cytidine(1402)-2'-O)-methyltransferase [Candidatus Peregrinibacteria bacterium]MBT4366215.1 16S rRNA (cytidine(1402)-2'-O)-methyltransferase [Candidatus Peregrinibacteria bacterium]MBT4456277.1 16S rRNA (cytidine(1402)-2'-O)-methyltransferase [Candidatus Peregrinibacteria bacterium]
MLYIVSTPIGNLEDITLRALRTLKEVDYIAAEDTRQTQKILNKYEIKTKTISFHSYSSDEKLNRIIDLLNEGKNVALVSDAGTPGISDPAYSLVKRAIQEEITISPIPGPSSLLAALVMSGLPMDKFLYLGFLPLKKGRQTLLKELAEEKRTLVIFESPHRILKTLGNLKEYLGNRQIAVCREITKIYEEAVRGTIEEVTEEFTNKKPKGEFVLVVKGPK